MGAFDFVQDKITLDWADLLPNNTQGVVVRDFKTDLVIVSCCDSWDCNLTSATPEGLHDVSKVILNMKINKKMRCSIWTMDKDLSKETENYGAFDAYVMWSIRSAVDQRLQALEIPSFLAPLSTFSPFHHPYTNPGMTRTRHY